MYVGFVCTWYLLAVESTKDISKVEKVGEKLFFLSLSCLFSFWFAHVWYIIMDCIQQRPTDNSAAHSGKVYVCTTVG